MTKALRLVFFTLLHALRILSLFIVALLTVKRRSI